MIIFLLSAISLPFVIFLLFWKEEYRFKVSVYLLLLFGFSGSFMIAGVYLFQVENRFDTFTASFFIASAISLIATKAPRKEYIKMLLIFLFPVLLLMVINTLHPLPSDNEIVHQIDADPDIWLLMGVLWLFSGIWALACFYRYCIWRIGRLKKERAALEVT